MDNNITFSSQKRRTRPVRKVQVSTHFDDFDLKRMSLGTPPPPAPGASVIAEVQAASTEKDRDFKGSRDKSSVEQTVDAPDDFHLDEFAYLAAPSIKSKTPKQVEKSPAESVKSPASPEDVNDLSLTTSKIRKSPITSEPKIASPILSEEDSIIPSPPINESSMKSVSDSIMIFEKGAADAKSAGNTETESMKSTGGTDAKSADGTGAKSTGGTDAKSIAPTHRLQSSPSPAVRNQSPFPPVSERSKSPLHIKDQMEAVVVVPPPPTPAKNTHLLGRDESKPLMLPVKPNNGAPSGSSTQLTSSEESLASKSTPTPTSKSTPALIPTSVKSGISSPLSDHSLSSEDLKKMKEDLEKQKDALNNEKKAEPQLLASKTQHEEQKPDLQAQNERMEKMEVNFLEASNELIVLHNQKIELEHQLSKALAKLEKSESNAKEYLESSDEVNALKDKLADYEKEITVKDQEIERLCNQLDEANQSTVAIDADFEEFVKQVEEEIKKMQELIAAQQKYNSRLKEEVETEYAYWKQKLNDED